MLQSYLNTGVLRATYWLTQSWAAHSYFPDTLCPAMFFFLSNTSQISRGFCLFVFNWVNTAWSNPLSWKSSCLAASGHSAEQINNQTDFNVVFKQKRFNEGSFYRRNKFCEEKTPKKRCLSWQQAECTTVNFRSNSYKEIYYSRSGTTGCTCSWTKEIQCRRHVRIFSDPLTPKPYSFPFYILQHREVWARSEVWTGWLAAM